MNFIAARGRGDPNEEDGAYKQAIGLLYGIAFTIKMSKLGDRRIEGYFDYVVPPLEGFWWQDGVAGIDYAHKEAFRPDWPKIIVDALKFCLMTKYEQSEAFRTELARTGDRFIVEKAHQRADSYSAKLSDDGTTWTGGNLMGRLLMELRDRGKLEYKLPEDAMKFGDLLE